MTTGKALAKPGTGRADVPSKAHWLEVPPHHPVVAQGKRAAAMVSFEALYQQPEPCVVPVLNCHTLHEFEMRAASQQACAQSAAVAAATVGGESVSPLTCDIGSGGPATVHGRSGCWPSQNLVLGTGVDTLELPM